MRKTTCLFALAILLAACEKLDIEKGTPDCIVKEIRSFNKSACDNGASVMAYTFQGVTVYVFVRGNCGADFQSAVMDAQCNTLGMLGGITGNTLINGEEFSNAVYLKTVWAQ